MHWAKAIAHSTAVVLISPLLLVFWSASALTSKDQALTFCSQLLALCPGLSGCFLRSAFYRFVIDEFHPSARIGFGALLSKCSARIEENVYVGPYCQLGLVTLKKDVLLGPAVQIPSGAKTHGFESLDAPIREQPGEIVRITIHQDCWIGGGTIVLADIDEQTVVGAGSVVTRPLPNRVIAAGNPASVIRSREVRSSPIVNVGSATPTPR